MACNALYRLSAYVCLVHSNQALALTSIFVGKKETEINSTHTRDRKLTIMPFIYWKILGIFVSNPPFCTTGWRTRTEYKSRLLLWPHTTDVGCGGKKEQHCVNHPVLGCNVKNCSEPGNRSCHQSKNDNSRNKNLPQHVCCLFPEFFIISTEFPFLIFHT